MEELKTFLEELGFGKNEVIVYTTLLKIGESTVLQISKKTAVHRSNVYEALDSLRKKGLVSSIENPVRKYFPRDPKCLLEFIKGKEMEFHLVSQELNGRIFNSSETKIGRTIGKLAFRNSLLSLLDSKNNVYILGMNGNSNDSIDLTLDLFNRERIKNKVKMKIIYNNIEKNLNKKLIEIKKTGLVEIKKSPQKFDSNITTFISEKKVIIINWIDLSIVELEDRAIAKDFIGYFNFLWSMVLCNKKLVLKKSKIYADINQVV